MSSVREVLEAKSREVYTIEETCSVADAVAQMVKHEVGSLVVVADDKPVGMFTERDVMRIWMNSKGDTRFRDIPMSEVMTRETIVVGPTDTLDYVMSVMIKNKIRHLPVVDENRVVGLVSMRDVVRAQVTNLKVENHYLREYIRGKHS